MTNYGTICIIFFRGGFGGGTPYRALRPDKAGQGWTRPPNVFVLFCDLSMVFLVRIALPSCMAPKSLKTQAWCKIGYKICNTYTLSHTRIARTQAWRKFEIKICDSYTLSNARIARTQAWCKFEHTICDSYTLLSNPPTL